MSPQADPMQSSAAFLKAQEGRITGDECSCRSLNGLYDLRWQTSDGGTYTQRIKVRNVTSSDFPSGSAGLPADVRTVASFTGTEDPAFHGIIVETDKGWDILAATGSLENSAYSGSESRKLLRMYLDSRSGSVSLPDSVAIKHISFDEAMVEANGPGVSLRFNSMATIGQVLAADPGLGSRMRVDRIFANHSIRVPPEMYELLDLPEFQNAMKGGEYSHVIDLIYAKAKELSHGDITQALFMSLLTVDLLERGACGAVFGIRGLTIVPPSIFDHEEFSAVESTRRDSPQHFIGAALGYRLYGKFIPETFEEGVKFFNDASIKIQNGITDATCTMDDFEGSVDGNSNPFSFCTSPYFAKPRRSIDNERDLYYNYLGFRLGKLLEENPEAKPSDVLRAADEAENRRAVGFSPDLSKPWRAADPHGEEFKIFAKPPEERRKTALPGIGYSACPSCPPGIGRGLEHETWDLYEQQRDRFLVFETRAAPPNTRVCNPAEKTTVEVPTSFSPVHVDDVIDICWADENNVQSLMLLCENSSVRDYRMLACGMANICANSLAVSLGKDFERHFGPFPSK